jgi:hypothetical protein
MNKSERLFVVNSGICRCLASVLPALQQIPRVEACAIEQKSCPLLCFQL